MFKRDVALFTDERAAQYGANSPMSSRQHDHRVGEDATEKIPVIKVRKSVCRVFEVAPEDLSPAFLVTNRCAVAPALFLQRIRKKVSGLERVIDAFAGDWVCETGSIANECPSIPGRFQVSPTRQIQGWNLRSKKSNPTLFRHAAVILRFHEIRQQASQLIRGSLAELGCDS